ncbi:hypothetical protein TNCV_4471081 [Trichonephila clavipes]|uniref:Uncharacterized protein n=1 Tax=Trichonephila clavipes TaxID=2585209 RepID=A0A8X6VAI8_TRICX|nr:hypothetical protein TNCV_4471081 [Trichonephila clavipes]
MSRHEIDCRLYTLVIYNSSQDFLPKKNQALINQISVKAKEMVPDTQNIDAKASCSKVLEQPVYNMVNFHYIGPHVMPYMFSAMSGKSERTRFHTHKDQILHGGYSRWQNVMLD